MADCLLGKNILAVLLIITAVGGAQAHAPAASDVSASPQFSENKGQWNADVFFRMKFNTGVLFLEKTRLAYSFMDTASMRHTHHGRHASPSPMKGHSFFVHFENSSPEVTASGMESFSHYENYFIGNDESKWASGIRVFQKAKYHNLYPGIDLLFEGNEGHLKYSFIVQPYAAPDKIKMRFDGVMKIFLDDGNLHYTTTVNEITERHLYAYQEISGTRVDVPCKYVLHEKIVSFEFPDGYNSAYPLVIDPTLVFSTYTGSFADNFGFTATYDNSGHLYAGGIVFDIGYPTTAGAFDESFNYGTIDVSLTKFNPTGTGLIYSTYLGGQDSENPSSIIVNDQDELIVLGTTGSPDFPTTLGAYDRTFNYGVAKAYPNNGPNFLSGTDIFVCKFNAAGTQLEGSTFIGGSGNDGLNDNDIAGSYGTLVYSYGDQFRGEVLLDAAGNIYGVSSTLSANFPVTAGAFQQAPGGGQDAVVFKFTSSLTTLTWSSYLGGTGADAGYNIFIDDQNNVYVSGGTEGNFPATPGSLYPTYRGGRSDGYIARISASGNAILSATYIGTSGYDQSYFIDADGSGNVYVVGQTDGSFPVSGTVYSNPNSGQYLAALTPNLSSLIFSTVFGRGDGDPDISPTAFLVDNCRNIYVAGWAGNDLFHYITPTVNSTTIGLPLAGNPYQSSTDGSDFYFMVLSQNAASLTYATYFGSPFARDHVDGGTSRFDKNGIIYEAVCAGCGGFSDFPTTPGAWSNTNNSFNCNEGLIKYEFQLIGVDVSVSASPANGCVPLTVNFASNGINAKEYWWDFGNGSTSTAANPTFTYAATGTYQVTLIGLDSTSCDNQIFSDTSRITIIVRDDSIAARFEPVIIANCDSFIVRFSNNSLNATNYIWNFGDGNSSTLVSPTHSYTVPGTYDISLIVTNPSSCNQRDTIVKTVSLTGNITAGISIPDTLGCVPFTAAFNNASAGGVEFLWNFGDGDTSALENPSHTYSDTGLYNITLIITDTTSCNVRDTAAATVRVSDKRVTTAFSLDTLAFECDSMVISFTNQSSNFTSWLWDFGDGVTSTALNPTHTFTASDSFTITLTTFNPNACNSADTSAQLLLLPSTVQAAFEADEGCAPHDVSIENHSSNATSYLWRLWNGTTTTDTLPVITNLDPGTYSITLTAYNPATCNDSSTAAGTISVHESPRAFFTTDKDFYELFQEIQFNNQSTDAVTYSWNFGDDNNSSDENPVHAYIDTGAFLPCLTVTNEFGCDSTYCKRLLVDFIGIID
ncbi:MAG TPA: PKD domain-containing protein, partial [Chitinophagales bacterium]|nr:PKD domain-containing protein [Chitinophagales bacterium]